MNRSLKEATVKRYHYDTHRQLEDHLVAFLDACNFAKRMKTLRGLTPYGMICEAWADEPDRFKYDPVHLTSGLKSQGTVQVKTNTFDGFCNRHAIETVHFAKCDTEGHDINVIRGALGMLRAGRVVALQFEYNHRWVYERAFLKDAFDLVSGLEYRIGRIRPRGVELFDEWHPELERFFESNYIVLKRGSESLFDARICRFDGSNVYA